MRLRKRKDDSTLPIPEDDDSLVHIRVSRKLAEALAPWSNPVQLRMAFEEGEWQLYVRAAAHAIREQAIAQRAARQ